MFIAIIVAPYLSNAQRPIPAKAFSFNLSTAATTSAGVYTKDGILIRTLWSGQKYNAGKHDTNWDGKDDEGKQLNRGSYNIKVLSNNVKYTWEGVVGNTSDSLSGSTVFHSMERIYSLAIIGKIAYFTTHYNEQSSGTFKFNIDDPHKRIEILNKGIAVKYVATDGKIVYWAGSDANIDSSCFVYGTNCEGDGETIFQQGKLVKTKYARSFKSAIDIYNQKNIDVSGLAVQKKGAYLFIAHQKLNLIDVLDKTTGQLIRSVPIESPGLLSIDADDNLWIIHQIKNSSIITKFKAASNGNLNTTNININNVQAPVALNVAPDNQTILIADAGDSQQLKSFDTKNGNFKWAFGKSGGYNTDPEVTNDKFYFSDCRSTLGSTIAFQSDGSFWVEDAGNSRLQHYSEKLNYINRIMFLSISYSIAVDANNPVRVFSDYLEFKVDYDKPLKADNNSWTLVKNWGAIIPPDLDNKYARLKCLTTLNNGHTYAETFSKKNNKWVIVELPANGPLRISNIQLSDLYTQLYPDGSLRKESPVRVNQPVTWTKRPLIKFDNLNNPSWGEEEIIASLPSAVVTDPIFYGNINLYHAADITSSNILVLFNSVTNRTKVKNWHLGGIALKDNKWRWRTAQGTEPTTDRNSKFPLTGEYDNSLAKHSGSIPLVIDRNIFWGFYGEGWHGTQVNKWNHIFDDGLFIGQMGTTGLDGPPGLAAPMMAGNAFSAALIKTKTGDLYLYHNDESFHSGIHRWKITNLGSITEQIIKINI